MRTLEAVEAITAAGERAERIAERAHFATESIAYTLARAYTANPYLNRKILATLAISGMNEAQINQIGNIATQRMLADGVAPIGAPPSAPPVIAPRVNERRPSPAMEMRAPLSLATGSAGPGTSASPLVVGNTTGELNAGGQTPYYEININDEDAKPYPFPIVLVRPNDQLQWLQRYGSDSDMDWWLSTYGGADAPEPFTLTQSFGGPGTSAVTPVGGGLSPAGQAAQNAAATAARHVRSAAASVDRGISGVPVIGHGYRASKAVSGAALGVGFEASKGFVRNASIGIESVWEFAGNVAGMYEQQRRQELIAQNSGEQAFLDQLSQNEDDRASAWRGVWEDTTKFGKALEATQVGQVARGFITGDQVDLGSGWFSSAELRARQAEAQKELLGTLIGPQGEELIYTLGRGLMSDAEGVAITDNAFIYSLISGAVDGAVALVADPTKKVPFIGWGKRYAQGLPTPKREAEYYWWQKVARQLADDDAIGNRDAIEYAMSQGLRAIGIRPGGRIGSGKVIGQANNLTDTQIAQRALLLDQMGMVGTPDAPIFLRPEFAKWLTSNDATRVIEYLTRTNSARQIHQFFGWKIGRKLATDIADAKSADEVLDVMARALANPGLELESQLRLFPTMGVFNVREKGLWVKRNINSYTRAGQYLPTGVKMMLNEPTQFMAQFDKIIRSLPVARHAARAAGRKAPAYDQTFLDDVFDEMSRAFDGSVGDVTAAILKVEELLTQTFVGMGFTVDQAGALTRLREEIGRTSAYMQADLGRGVGQNLMSTPLAISQILQDGVFLVNPQALEQTLRQGSRIREFMRHKTRWGRYNAQRYELAEQLADAQDNVRDLVARRDNLQDMITQNPADPALRAELVEINKELASANRAVGDLGVKINKVLSKIEELDVKNLTGEDARWADRAEKYFETGRYYWKMSAIWRLAYTTRVAPEETARILSSGAFESVWDYLATTLPERFGGLGGRYAVDAANTDLVSSSIKSWDLQYAIDEITEELTAVIGSYKAPGTLYPNVEAAARDLLAKGVLLPDSVLDAKTFDYVQDLLKRRTQLISEFDESIEALEKSVDTLWRASIGSDPAKSTATIMRERVNDLAATGHYSVADRLLPGQFNQWADGLADRISFYSGSTDMAFNAGMLNPATQIQLQDSMRLSIGGVDGTILDHFNAGRINSVEEFLAHYYHSGDGRQIWDEWYRSTRARNDVSAIGRLPEDVVEDALEWVLRQTEELSYLSGGTNRPRGQQLALERYSPTGDINNAYDIVPSLNGLGAEPFVLEAIHNGSFDGRPLSIIRVAKRKEDGKTKAFDALMERIKEFGNTNPNAPQRVHFNTRLTHGEPVQNVFRRVAGAYFRTMYGVPSDVLSRHPLWKRTYWQQITDLMPLASEEQAAQILEAARRAKVPQKMMNDLTSKAGARIGAEVEFEIIDKMASIAATDYVADLLYDASKRGATADALRFIIPFGDAFKEVYAIWSKLLFGSYGKPAIRLQQAIEAGRKATALGPGDIYGIDEETGVPTAHPDGVPEGMFWQDPTNGEFMFHLPFSSQIINGAMRAFGSGSGAPRNFDSPLRNANIFGNIFPGLMPGASQAVNYLMPDSPSWNAFRRFINPMGEQDPQIFPVWARRASAIFLNNEFTAGFARLIGNAETDPVFLRARNQIINQKLSERAYDYEGNVVMRYPPGREGWEQLQRDAHDDALILYTLRGIANFIGPAAPLVRYSIETDEGNVMAALITSELRREANALIEEGQNPDEAMANVLIDYGPYIYGFVSSNNKTSQPGIDSSDEWREWYQVNKDFMAEYKLIAGYFGPTGEYSQTAANALEQAKLYGPMTPEEKYEQLATRMIYLRLNRVRDQLPPEAQRTLEQRRYYANFRSDLEKFWGVSVTGTGLAVRIQNATQMNQMETLVQKYMDGDPLATRIMETETGEALLEYMAVRSFMSQKAIADQGLVADGWKTARSAATYRDELRALGERLAEQNPGFSRIYYTVLARELGDQEDPDDTFEITPTSPPRELRPPRQP